MKTFESLSLFVFIAALSLSTGATAEDCSRITKQSLCNGSPGCTWVNGRCVNSSSAELDVADVSSGDGEWLGCAVDEQQCGSRAANAGYSRYHAERSYYCPNASKFGCWGLGSGAEEVSDSTLNSAIDDEALLFAGGWRCVARSQGFDKHGEHSATGSSKAEASETARKRCDLMHFPGACRTESCGNS